MMDAIILLLWIVLLLMKTNLFFTYNLKCILFWIWMHIKLLYDVIEQKYVVTNF